ncbi:flagellar hook-associated protein FlgK [Diaphorobacter sp. LR2014-1]|uniref:flagellar hook-associated protein FlgK n=1 Tax=Diaphorobacter sp. LR2014-1 TaxID=1933219 RepID=UPI000CDB1DFD|nr:flagellar hook-associated protein FlgK [Diaphorobacter sp. LR2014-1]POR10409.1 flagellar hook-associated protein FlgK [Diaphorobacter sp. LR2014-1]
MSLLNVGARALLANQVALQTTGHNIANVSTAGYSRQNVAMETVQGQFTGSGYIGNGVQVATILRNHNELLTRQAAAAQAVQAGDTVRAERLGQLQDVFQGGTSGLGAAITDMLNSLADVVASPTDITARTVTLTRMDEMAARMRSSAEQLQEIAYSVNEQLQNDATRINSLAKSIADVNEQIARVKGNGQTPNDLLDKRDQLIRELNQFIQTTQIPADDGTVGVFIGGSQALVLGGKASEVLVAESQQFPGSQLTQLFFKPAGGAPVELNEGMLGGGEVAGLLRFANQDLAEGRNLLGRMALAIGTTMNYQQSMGLTLDGQPGKPLFTVPTSVKGLSGNSALNGEVTFTDPTKFAASDYEVRFTPFGTPEAQIIRLSDGRTTPIDDQFELAPPSSVTVDGLTFTFTPPLGSTNERVLFKPFATAAANMQALVHSPRELAAANPINAAMGSSNGGSLQLAGLKATGLHWDGATEMMSPRSDPSLPPYDLPPSGGVTLEFDANGKFSLTGNQSAPVDMSASPPKLLDATVDPEGISWYEGYTSGQRISIDGWEITLQGTPKAGDKVTVDNALDPKYGDWYTRNAGNASALMALRDVKMFDESTLSDGYAGLMAQVGTRTQSAQYAAKLSGSIASNLEASRTAVSGVNLDEEAARLIQYQQAYQASAKMLQIAQNIFDNLIQTMGR